MAGLDAVYIGPGRHWSQRGARDSVGAILL